VDCDKKDSDIEDVRANFEESSKNCETAEEEKKKSVHQFEQEMHALRKEQESKVRELGVRELGGTSRRVR